MAQHPTRRKKAPRAAPAAALRLLPQIDEVLGRPEVRAISERHGRAVVAALLRQRLGELRDLLRRAPGGASAAPEALTLLPEWLAAEAARRTRSSLIPVINATGVVLHTNLGRAPLPESAIRRMAELAESYATLEYDLERGGRGTRGAHLDRLFPLLFPGRAALVVNNNAAAVLLALNTLAEGREVVVSRGELVEIGGSFRIPEILQKSGAILKEVGTTNKTRLADYERALGPRTGLILKVHPSNYRVVGFTAAVGLADLAALARRSRLPLVMDQGSGNLVDLRRHGLRDEPTVGEALAQGADLVCASGDKLLGGPQAGILIGAPALLERLRRNPLARALRVDKTILAGLEAVLLLHLRGTATAEVPVLRMIALDRDTIDRRARALVERLGRRAAGRLSLRLIAGQSLTGGGSAPEEGLPTTLVAARVTGLPARRFEERLRQGTVPVIARIEAGELLLDLRTVREAEERGLEEALAQAAGEEDVAARPLRR